MADRAGLYTGGLFILGAPFENRTHFNQTYRFAASLPLDVTSFWVLDYAYGSPLWQEAFQKGIVAEGENIVPAGSERGTQNYSTAEITRQCERFFFRYYRRPSYWIRQIIKFIRVRDKYLFTVLLVGLQWLIIRKCELFGERCRYHAKKLIRHLPIKKRYRKRRFSPSYSLKKNHVTIH